MKDYTIQNKKAWEYSAYDFWVKQNGTPQELASKMREESNSFGTAGSRSIGI